VSLKLQSSLETAILFAFSLLLLAGIIYYLTTVNNNNLQYETTPFVLSSLEFYNFQTIGSTCSFNFAFQTNSYLPYPNYELSFILNNGQRIVPEYNIYSESVTPVLSSGYQYTFSLNGVPNYNGSVCSVMGQQIVNHAYVKYVFYKNANGKIVVQPVSTNYVFKINSASTLPNQLYNNNTVFISGSVIPYSGYAYISYQNKTSVPGSPFTLGEYVYLPTGNYSLSYTNESNPVAFQSWSSSGGVVIQDPLNASTNMTVINNGEIYLDLINLLVHEPPQTFIIYSNKTYSAPPGKFNITANFSKNGYYTYYLNNEPYNGCIKLAQTSCVMSFNAVGAYTIGATFKNSTTFAEATPIKVYVFFNPLSAKLSSNETIAQNKTNVLLSVSTNGGLQPFTYSFYVNNAPIQNCTDISRPTCIYNIDNPPNDYIYNYTFVVNVSDFANELATTNNVIVKGFSGIIIFSSTTLTSDLYCNSLMILPGVTLTTDGYNIYCSDAFINDGTIKTGTLSNGGSSNGGVGGSVSNSYAGSGGGGGGAPPTYFSVSGGSGGSTLVPGGGGGYAIAGTGGNGSTPPVPTITNSLIQSWYNNSFTNYLSGAGGGGGGWMEESIVYGGAGGSGAYGIYIQANKIVAGTINANGGNGDAGTNGGGGGGGGGGGVILLAYGNGGYTPGSYNVSGGLGNPTSYQGGNGGNGQVLTYQYTTPPIPVGNATWVAQFNGQSSYAYGSLTNYFGANNPLTAIAWAYITPNGNGPIFGVTSCPPGNCWNMPFLSEDGLTVYGWLWGVNSNNPMGYTVPSAGWYMLAITYNPSGSGIEDFYVNGRLVDSASGQYSPSGTTDYWTTYISGAKPGGVNYYYNSLIGDVQAYSTVLTQSQIQTLYQEGVDGPAISNAGLISWWKLDNNTDDSSGNGHNGVGAYMNYIEMVK